MISLTRLSLANRLIVGLVTVAILVFGVVAASSLKQELLPSTQVPTAIITATYPGTAPELVAKDVATPLEQAISGVSGVTKVRSTSSNGVANLTVEWTYGLDSDTVVAAIRNAADSVRPQLPDTTEITVQAGSTDDIPVQVLAVASDAPLHTLAQQVDELVTPVLSKIDGVRQVTVSGENSTELAVTLKPSQLRKHDLAAAAVTQSVQAQALVVPAGTSYRGNTELAVQVGDSATSAAQVAAWPIATPKDGPVKLGSLATVRVRSIDATTVARAQGRPALSILILKDSDADAVQISHSVAAALPGLQTTLGQNAKFSVIFDQAPLIEQSIHDLTIEGALGLSFAVVIILIFLLSLRSTIITAISIPLSLLIAMIGLQVGNFSLNIFTLAALTVAVGRVVDDSIVVIENIKRRDTGATPLTPAAIIDSVRQVAGAVTASTLTTVAVFLPVAGVSGVVGELFRPFAVTVAVALSASLLVSMTIVPVLAYWFLRSSKRRVVAARAGGEAEVADRVTRLQRGYLPVLGFVLRRPVVTVIAAVLIFAGTMASATLLKTDFIGQAADKKSLQITQKLPVGTRLTATSEAAKKVETVLAGNPNVTSYLSTIGQGGSNQATINFTVASAAVSDQTKADVQSALTERPDVGDITVGSINQSGSTSDLTITVTGDKDAALRQSSERVQNMLRTTPGLSDVTSDLAEQRPVLKVDVDRTKAAAKGFTSSDVGQAISSALRGTKVGTVVLEGESRDVMVRGQALDPSPAQIAKIELPVSQLQQQKATDKATKKLEHKQDNLTDDQQAAADAQKAYSDQQQADANKAAQDAQDKMVKQRHKAAKALTKTRSQLAKLKKAKPPGIPAHPVLPPLPADVVAAAQALQQWAQQVGQLEAAVGQAKAGVSQLDTQIKASKKQATKTAAAQAKQQAFSDRQTALTDRQKALAKQQKKIADVRAGHLIVSDIAKVHDELAPSTVTHIDGTRSVTITATPTASDLGALTKTVQGEIDGLHDLPPGVTVTLGGASQDQQDAFQQLGLAMLAAIALVFVIMVATFKSLAQPLVLLVSIPFAATGAVAGLLLTNTALGVPAMVGLLMLIGIVVTNAIVLIDLINHYRRRGADLRTAVVTGARLRLRPIIMTATATICALIPMGLGLTGGGAFISRPLAVVVIGGLVSSTVLTLLLVPVLYTLVGRRGERKRLRALEAEDAPTVATA